jgi:hypothetical protein
MGVTETDILILKNVLEVLPRDKFEKPMKEDSLDMDEREIMATLLSYRGYKHTLKKSHSDINIRK